MVYGGVHFMSLVRTSPIAQISVRYSRVGTLTRIRIWVELLRLEFNASMNSINSNLPPQYIYVDNSWLFFLPSVDFRLLKSFFKKKILIVATLYSYYLVPIIFFFTKNHIAYSAHMIYHICILEYWSKANVKQHKP